VLAIFALPREVHAAPLPVTLNLMSFNIRQDDGGLANRASTNGWYKLFSDSGGRRDRALSTIQTYNPDLLGIEEALPNQLSDLQVSAALAGYGYYGPGRAADGGNEHGGIFYRTSRFTPTGQGSFWLSATPTVPGTTFTGGGTDTGNPRMVNWMKLADNKTGQTYFVANTHWSLDSQARQLSANLMRTQFAALSGGLPMIVLGDFNTTLTSSPLQTLTGATNPSGFQLTDAYRKVFPTVSPNEATYHNFTGTTSGSSVDHIFYSASTFTATAAAIVRTTYNGLYPSDHYPITATLQVTPVPEPATVGLAVAGAACILLWRRRA
jgi:endonuclease/exonuclease/phosphatase family metal-dependent hydrolase